MRTPKRVRTGRPPAASVALVLALGSALAAPPAARAQDPGPLVTDRPDQTESALSVPAGFTQLELGVTYGREGGAGDPSALDLGGTLARVGLGHGLEARLGHAGWTSVRAGGETLASGFGDAELGLKLAGTLADGRTSIGLLGSVSVPIGEDEVSSGRADPSVRVLWSRSLSERLSLGANLGLAWETVPASHVDAGPDDVETELEMPYTAALGIAASDRVGLFLELFGGFGLRDDRPAAHALDGGLTVLLRDGWQLDASAGVGLDDDARDWFVASGVSVRIPR